MNSDNKMMIGNGTPRSHSRAPLPKPILASFVCHQMNSTYETNSRHHQNPRSLGRLTNALCHTNCHLDTCRLQSLRGSLQRLLPALKPPAKATVWLHSCELRQSQSSLGWSLQQLVFPRRLD